MKRTLTQTSQKDIFKKSKLVISFMDKFLDDLQQVKINQQRELLLITGLGFLLKILRTFKAIHLICEAELAEEAHALLRVLVETVILIQNLFKEGPEERAYRYFAYLGILDEKMINAWKTNKQLHNFSPKIEQIVQGKIDELKKEYGDKTYEEMKDTLW